jgi:Fur family ferric uptake transcriptional regulator
MPEELKIFSEFLKKKNLKSTHQREQILRIFLDTKSHLTVEDLYNIVKKEDSGVGQATVFRTLKLLCEANIAKEVYFGDKRARYERKCEDDRHDHLVCLECGGFIEAAEPKIEKLQSDLCKKYDFMPKEHKTEIFGICSGCRNSKQ